MFLNSKCTGFQVLSVRRLAESRGASTEHLRACLVDFEFFIFIPYLPVGLPRRVLTQMVASVILKESPPIHPTVQVQLGLRAPAHEWLVKRKGSPGPGS